MTRNPLKERPRRTLGVLFVTALFLAGPTPGDIGGCGGDLADQPLPGVAAEAEYDYFDQGFCAGLCYALRECGVLCLSVSPTPPNCVNESADAYRQCVRGGLRGDIFQGTRCPHSCREYGGNFVGATMQDIATCRHSIEGLSCNDLALAVRSPPSTCTAVCQ